MAKNFDGKTYITLAEWQAEGNTLPDEMRAVTIPSLTTPGSITFADIFSMAFSDRYLFTESSAEFGRRLTVTCYSVLPTLSAKLSNLEALINGFMDDSETETSDTLRSPNGTLQQSGFSSGGVLIKRQGGASGDIDRIIRYQNEVNSIISDYVDQFEPLFIGVFSEWGADDGN